MSSTEIGSSCRNYGTHSQPSQPCPESPLPPAGNDGDELGVVKSASRQLHQEHQVPELIERLPTEILQEIGSYLDDMDVTCLALTFPSLPHVYGPGPLERSLGGLSYSNPKNYDVWKRVVKEVNRIVGGVTYWLCIPCGRLHGMPVRAEPGYKDLGERDLIIDIIGPAGYGGDLLCHLMYNLRQVSLRPHGMALEGPLLLKWHYP